ncbi:MAG: hypothetical protein Q4F67_07945 [Propionibacteriaceae bacterium]|nr:hypothetical protein [Propionibacteriaceae bacterium]
MKMRLVPSLVLAAVLAVSACSGEPGGPAPGGPEPGDTAAMPQPDGQVSPDSMPAPNADGSVSAANLPEADDLQWNDAVEWETGETTTGTGAGQLSVCQQTPLDSLGANSIQVRTFEMTGGDGQAAAVAMSFDTAEVADQAAETLEEWVADCTLVLEGQNRTDGNQVVAPTVVFVPHGARGQVSEWAYTTPEDVGEFESQGVVVIGNRVALLVMRIEGQDNNWSTEPDAPEDDLHPMIRSLTPLTDKLVR